MAKSSIKTLSERGVISGLLLGLDTYFKKQWFGNILEEITSTQIDGEDYAWLGAVDGMTENLGDPKFSDLSAFKFFIANKRFQAGFRVKKQDWDHGKVDLIMQRAADQAELAASHPGELLQTAISNGAAKACYDGQYFFDTDHPYTASGTAATQSNLLTVKVANPARPTVEEYGDAILQAVVAMYGMKDDKGNSCNMSAFDFMVATGLPMAASQMKALTQSAQGGGNSNFVKELQNQSFNLKSQMLPAVTGTKFFVFRNDTSAKPFIKQTLDTLESTVLGRDSEYCKLNDMLLFMVKGSYNVGYGRYQHAVEVNFEKA